MARSSVLLALAACPLLAQSAPDPQLKEAVRLLFRTRSEASVRDGAQLCLRENDVEFAELLIKVLDGPQPHFRDIVWEVLPDLSDPYVRRRFADDLRNNRKNEGKRHWCAELLGIWGEADWVPYLAQALSDRDARVQRAAARSLGMIGHADGAKVLARMQRSRDARLRAEVLEALARIDAAAHLPALHQGLADDAAEVRCALLGAVPALLPDEVEALSLQGLRDDDWRVRMQAAENLAAARTRSALDHLIGEAVGDGRPAVATRVVSALREITGQLYRKPIEWKAWWRDNRDTFAIAEGTRQAAMADDDLTVASFNGIRVDSDHVAFLIDHTPSMKGGLQQRVATKAAAAAQELEATLARLLGDEVTFNVGLYDERITWMSRRPVKLTTTTMAKAVQLAGDDKLGGHKDIWNAVSTAVAAPDIDTVFLLSSGEPEVGRYVHWNRVARHLVELNRFHKTVVHGVVYSGSDWYREQVREICKAMGGDFKAFQ